MKCITVITTTYNRGYCLHQLYESLKKQEYKKFQWLVIDDGSNDNTKELIQGYIDENSIDIEYHYHQNIGMTASRNIGYELAKTELSVIIDSDDWLESNALNNIIDCWEEKKSDNIAGIIALNQKRDESFDEVKLLPDIKQLKFRDLHDIYRYGKDAKLIYRTDIAKKYPYPTFEGERSFPASFKFRAIDEKYDLVTMNKVVCIVDFNQNGQTFDRIKQYKTNPKGYAFYRNEMMRISKNKRFILKQAIHYISSSFFAKDYMFLFKASKKLYVVSVLPLGIMFHLYIRNTKRRSLKFK
ncbi:hypothetical protein PESP_a0482 [Pseudoalteromonas espejiana DSM 9414]|uniref:Beta-glycosyltransferase n=1 Tax=Pseudoalteromonas espejiana TaxID=28107 RepID=A0A510Y123_9GAMM|nr:glycosyltransferase family A protein [Pseudoalteromonas espejiana]ASM48727.1 hypothetical protein PESP_a0482 [Pseudoalteromonas espejiana DSM 9414]GEK56994.1 beta-glycosyltransferase [Pseudoalteromonas espejiana]